MMWFQKKQVVPPEIEKPSEILCKMLALRMEMMEPVIIDQPDDFWFEIRVKNLIVIIHYRRTYDRYLSDFIELSFHSEANVVNFELSIKERNFLIGKVKDYIIRCKAREAIAKDFKKQNISLDIIENILELKGTTDET